MYGPEGNNAWWIKLKSGRHHLTTLRGKQIYSACVPDVWWSTSSRRRWELVMKDASRIPENACEMCQRYAVLWGML